MTTQTITPRAPKVIDLAARRAQRDPLLAIATEARAAAERLEAPRIASLADRRDPIESTLVECRLARLEAEAAVRAQGVA